MQTKYLKEMNKYIKNSFVVIMLLIFISCSKQNTPTPLNVDPAPIVPEEYYDALRAYKESDHPIMFGWVGGTGTPTPSARGNGYWDLPDSLDIVSLWGGYPPVGSQNFNDMQEVRKKKGTRFLWVMFGSGVQQLMKKNDSALFVNDVMTAIDHVAKAMLDTVNKYQIDGFDLDYEYMYGDISIFGDSGGTLTNDIHTQRLFKALSQYFGPLSGTKQLLLIDGQFDRGIGTYIDYFVQQTYGIGTATGLQGRYQSFAGGASVLPTKKFVVSDSYEQYRTQGSGYLEAMAAWNPVEGKKGGIGAYHLEYDYGANPLYPYQRIRKCIQIQNPAPY